MFCTGLNRTVQSHFNHTSSSVGLFNHTSRLESEVGVGAGVGLLCGYYYNFFLSIRMTQMTTFMGGTLCVIFVVVF